MCGVCQSTRVYCNLYLCVCAGSGDRLPCAMAHECRVACGSCGSCRRCTARSVPLSLARGATEDASGTHGHGARAARDRTCSLSEKETIRAVIRISFLSLSPCRGAALLGVVELPMPSCSFLQHAAQRHSRAILPVRHAFAKRLRARVPLRHRAPFATYMACASRPWAPSTRRSLDDHDRQRLRHLPRHLRADHLPRLDFCARPEHICIVLCRALRASSDPLRPARPQTARDTSNLLLVAHNISHRVRHRPGRLKSPTEAPPRRGACRRLHASGLPNIYGLRPAICRPRPCAAI